jgi:hypothetical protein
LKRGRGGYTLAPQKEKRSRPPWEERVTALVNQPEARIPKCLPGCKPQTRQKELQGASGGARRFTPDRNPGNAAVVDRPLNPCVPVHGVFKIGPEVSPSPPTPREGVSLLL